MRLRTSEQANSDVYNIHIHGALNYGVAAADAYLAGLLDAFALISANPRMSRERTELEPPVRVHHYRAHLIIYAIADDEIIVIRVLHHSADWVRWL